MQTKKWKLQKSTLHIHFFFKYNQETGKATSDEYGGRKWSKYVPSNPHERN